MRLGAFLILSTNGDQNIYIYIWMQDNNDLCDVCGKIIKM
jgi:hypothetical protein